ncbi:acyl-CoA thioesterase domain-containing protein, partial [Rhodococcus sp. EPR-157]|uniref:acyl-CoA thioesterase domain-containing protein n=1 Tax=Rhodococcus sp. EPR-157 TaxID=1813677 RepID=UPI000B0593A9
MSSPFKSATTLTTLERTETDGSYVAVIDSTWTIGPKVHGGTMLAACAAAAKSQLRGDDVQPLAVSVSYLSAPDPGEVVLTAIVRKRGKQVSHVDVEMTQGDRVAARAMVTLGRPDVDDPRHEVQSSLSSMAVEPPADTEAIGG